MHAIAERRGWKFHVMYGQTEAGPRISWLPHHLVSSYVGCIGQAIPGVSISIDQGELVVESPAVMMGYAISRADLVRGDDLDGRLLTGDLAEMVGPGIFRITGRKSRFIKILGNRVSLQDLEARLLTLGHVVYCVGTDDRLQLFTSTPNIEDIQQAANTLFSLPPRCFNIRVLPVVPRLPNGKIDYAELTRISIGVSE
jgi:long-subunit acyl-CoA synthetase (AMP-forming)